MRPSAGLVAAFAVSGAMLLADAASAGEALYQVVSPDTLIARAQEAVRHAVGPLPPAMSLSCRATFRPEPLILSAGVVLIDVTLSDAVPAAVMTPVCRVYLDDRLIRSVPIPLRLSVVGPRFHAKRRIDAGERIAPEAFNRIVEGIPPPWQEFVTDSLLATGMVAARTIAAGEALRRDLLARPAVVRRGDRVTLVVESATVRILATCVARTDGRLGESVRVVRDGTRRSLRARVVARDRVAVNLLHNAEQ